MQVHRTPPTRRAWSLLRLSAFLFAALAFVLVACGRDATEEASQSSSAASTSTRYEAENATTNLPTETKWPGFSGASYLCCWSSQGQYVTFHVSASTAGTYALSFGYSAGNGTATRQLMVNGAVVAGNQSFGPTANWSSWTTVTVMANLNAGANTVTLTYDGGSGSSNYINIDYLDASGGGSSSSGGSSSGGSSGTTRYEAENAASNLPTETVWKGYSGASYLCCWSSQGQYVTFNVPASASGTYTLAFGYSAGNGLARRQLKVNGSVVNGNFALGGTADWNTWTTASVSANLTSGNNQVTLTFDSPSGSTNYVNIDYLDVTGSGGSSSGSSGTSSGSSGSSSGGTTINDTDPSIVYSSIGGAPATWNHGTGDSSDYQGDEHYVGYCQTSGNPSVMGPMAVANFNGTGITLLAAKGNNLGIGAWSIDGGPWNTVDAYDPATKLHQQPLVSVGNLPSGAHALAFQQTCNRNGSSSNIFQVVDAYQIAGSPLPLSSASVANKSNGAASFSGSGWTCGTASSTNLGGVHCWDGKAGDTVSWSFTGSLIEMFGRPDTGDGLFDVYIDNVRVSQNVDGHYGTDDNDALTAYMLWAHKLSSGGSHTVKVVVNGTEDGNNGSENSGIKNLVQFDEFVAFP